MGGNRFHTYSEELKHIQVADSISVQSYRGITLIALVITIIILLILAGVVLNLTLGEHGILKIAENSGKNYVNAAEEEQKNLGDLLNETNNIINGTSSINNITLLPSIDGGTTHTAKQIPYTWKELNSIAKVISDNYGTEAGKINNNTEEVSVVVNGEVGTLGIGDWTLVNNKKVRILGFNHDILTNQNAYGEREKNIYAGISFEYAECITTAQMNSSDTNSGGWKECDLRITLNNTTYNSLENKEYIKEVNKQCIEIYNDVDSVTTVTDKLWLLSCSEIWNDGYESGYYGYAITKEGEQYKYYKNISTQYSSENTDLVKFDNETVISWWLRSPQYWNNSTFCLVRWSGDCVPDIASGMGGIAAGFSI